MIISSMETVLLLFVLFTCMIFHFLLHSLMATIQCNLLGPMHCMLADILYLQRLFSSALGVSGTHFCSKVNSWVQLATET